MPFDPTFLQDNFLLLPMIEERDTAHDRWYCVRPVGETLQPTIEGFTLFRCHFVNRPCGFVTDNFLELAKHQHY